MRDIVPKVDVDSQKAELTTAIENGYNSVPRRKTSLGSSQSRKLPSFSQYMNNYTTLRYKSVDAGSEIMTHDPQKSHKAEITIQLNASVDEKAVSDNLHCDKNAGNAGIQSQPNDVQQVDDIPSVPASQPSPPPPPPPPQMPLNLHAPQTYTKKVVQQSEACQEPRKLAAKEPQLSYPKRSFLDELKAKYSPKEYESECKYNANTTGTQAACGSSTPQIKVTQTCEKSQKDLMFATLAKANMQPKKTVLTNESAKIETIVPVEEDGSINKNDPRVKKLVYNTLRNYLGAYNSQANQIAKQHHNVVQDKGVIAQIRNMKSQGAPPPPPTLAGSVPAARIKSEIGERRNEPPLCVQNAMMTKDKKPFTYTPGGIDLSEIKSPRMARRIERNANAPGVGEYAQPQQTPVQNRPLPPSALAAMQPALPVQVFPAGAPPPPPPPPVNNPPPPPPMQSIPTKSVAGSNGIFERPDMTRIIPENPMALLRKTPKVERRTFLDELNDMERKNKQGDQYVVPAASQPEPLPSSPTPTMTNFNPRLSRQFSNNSSPQPYSPPSPQPASPRPPQEQSVPQMVQQPKQQVVGPPSPPVKTSNVNIGSLYIQPINQQQQQIHHNSPKPQTPPPPPQRQPQSPSTPQSPIPKLNTAPKPWQNQQRKEAQLPEWAQRHQPSPPKDEGIQPARIAIEPPQAAPMQMQPPSPRPGVEVVWVTQPEVYQHPGHQPHGQRRVPPQQTQPQQQQHHGQHEAKGTRIIPIQVEGQCAPKSPSTDDRNFNRQQSWTPTQSSSFKVLQKMTEHENEYNNQPQVEYGPHSAQQFPTDRKGSQGTGPKSHVRTIPIQMEEDRHTYVHPSQQTVEEPKKYMGSAIPSRAFRMVQAMTSNSLGPGESDM